MRWGEVQRRHLLGEQGGGVVAQLSQQESHAITVSTGRWLRHG